VAVRVPVHALEAHLRPLIKDDTKRGNDSHSGQVWDERRAVRLIGVGVSGFGERYEQLRLWEDEVEQMIPHPARRSR
jgi:hypothetical protein